MSLTIFTSESHLSASLLYFLLIQHSWLKSCLLFLRFSRYNCSSFEANFCATFILFMSLCTYGHFMHIFNNFMLCCGMWFLWYAMRIQCNVMRFAMRNWYERFNDMLCYDMLCYLNKNTSTYRRVFQTFRIKIIIKKSLQLICNVNILFFN